MSADNPASTEDIDIEGDFSIDIEQLASSPGVSSSPLGLTEFKPLWHLDDPVVGELTIDRENRNEIERILLEDSTSNHQQGLDAVKISPVFSANGGGDSDHVTSFSQPLVAPATTTPVSNFSSAFEWSQTEDKRLISLVEQHGQKWSKIAKELGTGRSGLEVKLRVRNLKRKSDLVSRKTKSTIVADGTNNVPLTTQKTVDFVFKNEPVSQRDLLRFPQSEIVNLKPVSDSEEEEVDITDDFSQQSNTETVSDLGHAPTTSFFVTSSGSGSSASKQKNAEVNNKIESKTIISSPLSTEPRISFTQPASRKRKLPKCFPEDPPETEVDLDPHMISELEQRVHVDFFRGSSQKTPERYLKIRNHIVEMWKRSRPNYLNKTRARAGLKSCGDVNSIGVIHDFLEQIGAINFGCEQTRYDKHKSDYSTDTAEVSVAHRTDTTPVSAVTASTSTSTVKIAAAKDCIRPRTKKNVLPVIDIRNGGYTLEHDASTGAVIAEVLVKSKPKPRASVQQFKLVPCRTPDAGDPVFRVVVDVAALLLMDAHAHLRETEVIGLLGGFQESDDVLRISVAHPCRSVSTNTECDMDPVSQSEAMAALQSGGYNVVGWYHSHPTFVPNPSVRDVYTQAEYQEMFSHQGQPFVAVILSPYLPPSSQDHRNNAVSLDPGMLCSVWRWWAVKITPNLSSSIVIPSQPYVPYALDAELGLDESSRVDEAFQSIFNLAKDSESIDLNRFYSAARNTTYLTKLLTSLQHRMTSSKQLSPIDDNRVGEILTRLRKQLSKCTTTSSESILSTAVSNTSNSIPPILVGNNDNALADMSGEVSS